MGWTKSPSPSVSWKATMVEPFWIGPARTAPAPRTTTAATSTAIRILMVPPQKQGLEVEREPDRALVVIAPPGVLARWVVARVGGDHLADVAEQRCLRGKPRIH